MKISKKGGGGGEGPCLWHIPMFRFPGVEREDDVFSPCLARAVCIFGRGGRGGEGGWL